MERIGIFIAVMELVGEWVTYLGGSTVATSADLRLPLLAIVRGLEISIIQSVIVIGRARCCCLGSSPWWHRDTHESVWLFLEFLLLLHMLTCQSLSIVWPSSSEVDRDSSCWWSLFRYRQRQAVYRCLDWLLSNFLFPSTEVGGSLPYTQQVCSPTIEHHDASE